MWRFDSTLQRRGGVDSFMKFDEKQLSGVAKYIPSSAGEVDFSKLVVPEDEGEQAQQIEALLDNIMAGNFEEEEEEDGEE